MRRRLAFAICGTLVVALLVAGLGTLLIAQVRAVRTTEHELSSQVVILRDEIEGQVSAANRPAGLAARLATIRRVLKLDSIALVLIRPDGTFAPELPAPLRPSDLDVATLRSGAVVTGSRGRTVYAAAAQTLPAGTFAVIATQKANTGLDAAFGWLLIGALLTLAVGVAVAVVLSRRLAKPIRQADEVARRIAAGELSARISDPPAGRHDELSDLVRNVNAMAVSLERAKGLEQQFLLSVSHDLRTPLTSIRGFAEAITDGTSQDPQRAAAVILSESRRLERLVRDLLDLARLDAQAFSFHPERVDLVALARDGADGFERPDVGVTGPPPGPPVWVTADPDRLAQVVANLVENGCKYARSQVTVGVAAGPGEAVLWVDDDGPGIDPEDRPHVFERLYTAKAVPVRAEIGSGLGLAIVRELAAAMGATVRADAAPGGGARLVVSLPPAEAPVPLPPPAAVRR